jgi:hypothetical protein
MAAAEIRLTFPELTLAGVIGVFRNVSGLQKRSHRHGYTGDGWGVNINGAAAEMAVARYFDRFWSPLALGDLSAQPGDVGPYQVRSTTRTMGSLILHEDDPDDARFYLVITEPPLCRIVGWISGRDGKQARWWREDVREPAYFVPQSALTRGETLL